MKRERGRYSLSTFGIMVYHTQEIIGKAVNEYWKLKAIDSIGVSGIGEIPKEQLHTIIDKLIVNQEIKNILLEYFKEKSCETPINEISALNLYQKK